MPEIKPSLGNCDHSRVRIIAIEEPWDGKQRVIRGHCEDCSEELRRTMTQFEKETGQTEIWYQSK